MIKKLVSAVLALSLLALSGCSGGSIYSNFREIEQLVVVQTMGFDSTKDGVKLSISSGDTGSSGGGSSEGGGSSGGKSTLRMSAEAASITSAQEKVQDYSPKEQLFFGHVDYIVLGRSALDGGVEPYFDFIERSSSLHLDIPVFAVSDSEASELLLNVGGKDTDATSALRSVERNLELRGDCYIFSAAEIAADMNTNGAALICCVRCADAKEADKEAEEGEKTALPDGYIIINEGKAAGHIPYEMAGGVNILKNKAGPISVVLDGATVQLDKCGCTIKPVFGSGKLEGLDIKIKATAALEEVSKGTNTAELEALLSEKLKSWVSFVLDSAVSSGCDFLQLGSSLETKEPRSLRGMTKDFGGVLPYIYYNVVVEAKIERSFDLDLTEGGQ